MEPIVCSQCLDADNPINDGDECYIFEELEAVFCSIDCSREWLKDLIVFGHLGDIQEGYINISTLKEALS